MKFETVEQVQEHFDHEFTMNQYIDILNFLRYDVIPADNGCASCDRGVVRKWVRRILDEESKTGFHRPVVRPGD